MLRNGQIQVRDAGSGRLERRWPISENDGPVALADAQSGIAAYTEGIAIHLLRLSDGRDLVLSIPGEEGPVYADLEPEGLYYSFNQAGGANPGRVCFVPWDELTRLLDARGMSG